MPRKRRYPHMHSDEGGYIELPGSWEFRRQLRAMKKYTAESDTGNANFTFSGRMSIGRVRRLIEALELSDWHAYDIGRYPGTDYRAISVQTPETSPAARLSGKPT